MFNIKKKIMKKSIIRKARIFLLTGTLLIGAVSMQSQNLYVYGNDGSKQTITVDNLGKLTFTATELVVHTKTGVLPPVLFTDLRLFSLHDFNFGDTGIASTIESAEAVRVYPNPAADFVTVSGQNISGVTLYNMQGQKLWQINAKSSRINVPLTAFSAGIYFLHIASEKGTSIHKIIKN
jgi:hypothetical protein